MRDTKAKHFAINLGIAMQITNIVRDVYEDAQRNRIYIPLSYFKDNPTCSDILSADYFANDIINAKKLLIKRAEHHYKVAWKGIKYIPFKNKIIIAWAGLMYREIGCIILKDQNKFYKKRAVVSSGKKFALILPAIFKAFIS